MFLLNKYSLKTSNDSLFNNEILKQLIHIASYEDIPHIIISGPHGSGKKTLVKCFLEALYDKSVNDLSKMKYHVTGSSKKNIIEIMQSNYHIVIEPTKTNHDKHLLQDIIKQYAMHKIFNIFVTQRKFKTIVIYDIENLAHNSQAALRRTMELYANTCRFIMVCNNLSKVFDPLRSRCRIFCVQQPSNDDITRVVNQIAMLENIKLSQHNITYITDHCGNNIKEAIWILDEMRFGCTHELPLNQAYDVIVNIMLYTINCKNIVHIFDKELRSKIYDILTTTISGTDIIIGIMDRLIEKINIDHINIKIIQYASDAEHNLVHGRRNIIHIDNFVANVIREILIHKDLLMHIAPKKLPQAKALL